MRSDEPMFQPLAEPPARWSRFGPSLVGHTVLVATAIAIPVAVVQEEPRNHRDVTALVAPARPRLRPVVRTKQASIPATVGEVKRVALASPTVAPVRVHHVPIPGPAQIQAAKIEVAPAPVVAAAIPVATLPAPAPLAPLVRTGGFSEAPAGGIASIGGSTSKVAVGGFGDSGGSSGAGTGGAVRKVALAGFGDANPVAAAPAVQKAVAPSAPVQTQVEITFKPRPAYTDKARAQHLEGEVQLEVVFGASGTVDVLRVVKGLGLGLDESARDAAIHIRFHPATRGGSPVDVKGIVHIAFELS